MSKIKEVYYLDYFNNLIEGNKYNCSKILNMVVEEGAKVIDIYTDLFQRSLYQVGKLWEQNKLTIANEHLGTQITENLMNSLYTKITSEKRIGKKAVITCIDKEYHKIGAKMVADIFELNRWDSYFLGASTPTKEILRFIKEKQPEVVGLSFNFYINLLRFYEVVDLIKKDFPDIEIIVGGQGVEKAREELNAKYSDVKFFNSIVDLDKYLKK